MSFLAPLYFLGALAIAGPIIFHLIRRQPKGEVEFSSLMFLDSTPPRLTKRNRLENWPLLLLRCAAIAMLAFAFARPFLPLAQSDSVAGVKQAVVLLIDQSASMQRTGLWDQATRKAAEIIDQSDNETLLSVISFDSRTYNLLSLEESTRLVADARKGAAKDAINKQHPTWQSTDIGKAIRFAADQAALLELGNNAKAASTPNNPKASAVIETRIVLLSDLQSGAAIESLQGYEWPQRVWLDIQPIAATTRGNVSLRVLPQTQPTDAEATERKQAGDTVRVQVTQSDDGDSSTFGLRFDNEQQDAKVVQVPPGQSRFFTVALPKSAPVRDGDVNNETENPVNVETATLHVSGDRDSFDNAYHFIRPKRIEQQVLFVEAAPDANGSVPQPRDTLSFYAAQLPWSDANRKVGLSLSDGAEFPSDLDAATTPLLVLNPSATLLVHTETLKRYLAAGGRVLVVLDRAVDEANRNAISELLDAPELAINEAAQTDYALIASVDFKSALIAPLADPGVNDFSNIRVWQHRSLGGLDDAAKVTLKLDDGDPLLLTKDFSSAEQETPPGKLWILATGWQPSQSQFALSTKFVPILLGMLGPNLRLAPESLVIGDPLADDGSQADGQAVATEPGIVELDDGSRVAVNLDPLESQTSSIDLNRIAEFGAVVSSPAAREQEETAQRALRDIELEARQGWWQWLILATLGFIAGETLLAAKQRQNFEGETA